MTDIRFHRCLRWMLAAVASVAVFGMRVGRRRLMHKSPRAFCRSVAQSPRCSTSLVCRTESSPSISTSQFPPVALKTHKNVGYMRALSTEGVLSLAPDLIIASDKSGPPEVVRALKSSGIEYFEVNDDPNPEALAARVKAIAGKVGKAAAGEDLVKRIQKGFADLAEARTQPVADAVGAVRPERAGWSRDRWRHRYDRRRHAEARRCHECRIEPQGLQADLRGIDHCHGSRSDRGHAPDLRARRRVRYAGATRCRGDACRA